MAQLQFRRLHPGGGPLGRCSYGLPGVPGIVVFDVALFADGKPPATLELNVPMAQPTARKVAGVTSAVVAQANSDQAAVKAEPIATPAVVAQVATVAASEVVAQAKAVAAQVVAASAGRKRKQSAA